MGVEWSLDICGRSPPWSAAACCRFVFGQLAGRAAPPTLAVRIGEQARRRARRQQSLPLSEAKGSRTREQEALASGQEPLSCGPSSFLGGARRPPMVCYYSRRTNRHTILSRRTGACQAGKIGVVRELGLLCCPEGEAVGRPRQPSVPSSLSF